MGSLDGTPRFLFQRRTGGIKTTMTMMMRNDREVMRRLRWLKVKPRVQEVYLPVSDLA